MKTSIHRESEKVYSRKQGFRGLLQEPSLLSFTWSEG
jgi:hypothetical protein